MKIVFLIIITLFLFPEGNEKSGIDETDTIVSLSKNLQPIFNKHCVECHYEGDQEPYLTKDQAYESILSNYINPNFPYLSSLYTQVDEGIMPDGKKKIPEKEIQLILKWIKQGYKDN